MSPRHRHTPRRRFPRWQAELYARRLLIAWALTMAVSLALAVALLVLAIKL